MINIVNHTIFLDEEKFNSYKRHYVKGTEEKASHF